MFPTMSSIPSPRQLLQNGRSLATPSINAGSGKPPIARGYFWAAQELCGTLRDNRGPVDTAVYPALFLFRHGLELAFKDLVNGFGLELAPGQDPAHGHHLSVLWGRLEPELRAWASDIPYQPTEPPPKAFFTAMDMMSDLVGVLDEIDPTGEHARYDLTLKGEGTLSRYPIINLEVLDPLVAVVAEWAQFAMHRRTEEVSFVEARRRERAAKSLRRCRDDQGCVPSKDGRLSE
jgi:hypothetical protein